MPCHVPTASGSSRRRTPTQILARFDLENGIEHAVFASFTRLHEGRSPALRCADLKRLNAVLVELAEWLTPGRPMFSVLRWNLQTPGLTWEHFHRLDDATQAFDAAVSQCDLQRFGALVRTRRESAGLSRADLAEIAHLSESTLRNMETARHIPSRVTVKHLLQVPMLRLTREDIPSHVSFGPTLARMAPRMSESKEW